MIGGIQEFAYTMFLGLPVLSWMGMLTVALLLITAYVGYGLMKGWIRTTIKTHQMIAGAAIAIGIIHAIISLSIYL
ncbi:hypothetical protein CUJ83_14655 [Methanocella sp. CWC-04]|uniref:Uncharacterized protein n=1 Tax=Methanooceanicella nereidis TaxID=2052831 RepID=A0AAP2RGK5_9EURY|nr:hypothetical protein [Methanocella sp. CWC-04]MCD1296240.1 hypothetical protein [Methanocella sp. CWC-04]